MPENKFFISETKIFVRKDTIALLEINSGRVFKIDEPTKQIILEIKKSGNVEKNSDEATAEIIEELKSAKLISDHEIKTHFIESEKDDDLRELRAMDLLIAQSCNMSCKYCFADEGAYCGNKGLMSWEIAKKSIDFFIENSGKNKELNVAFFGGEPLMNVPVIKKVVEYSRKKTLDTDKLITFGVSTNGTLLEPELIEYFKVNRVNVQISIDGGPDSQNLNRPLVGNLPSYDVVINKAETLFREKWKITARATVTKNNITKIKEDAVHLLNAGFNSVHIEHAAGTGNNDLLINTKIDFRKMTEQMLELFDTFESKLKDGELLNINNFRKSIYGIRQRNRRFYGCGAGRGYLCIDINGDISTCHRLTGNQKHRLGNIHKDELSLVQLKEIKERSYVLNKEICRKCWAKFLCGGDCIAIAEEINNNIGIPDTNKCIYNKKLIERSILTYASLPNSIKEKIFNYKENKSAQN